MNQVIFHIKMRQMIGRASVKEQTSAMLVTILPYVLVANLTVDDVHRRSEWAMYGPECTYDVLVNTSLANIVQENDNFCTMIATELKCRPKGEDSLSCYFQNSRFKRPDPGDNRCSNAKDFVPTKYKFVGDEPFEIRFNSKGIENLVVHRSIPRWRLEMIKTIVSQLNIGFDLRERREKFVIMENSVLGHCEVVVDIIHKDSKMISEENDDDSTENSQNFEINFMDSSASIEFADLSTHEGFQVKKVREPEKCPRRMTYFFGNHEDYSHDDKQVYMNMTISSSYITITRDKFASYTISEGIMKTANKSQIMRPYEKISLKLKRIDLARSSLPEIQNPASASLFPFSYLQTIPEDA